MFEAEVIVQAAGSVLLNDKLQTRDGFWVTALRLGRFAEVAFAFVFFQAHAIIALSRRRLACAFFARAAARCRFSLGSTTALRPTLFRVLDAPLKDIHEIDSLANWL